MSQNRSPRFRPSAFDRLEDRAVPSAGVSYAQVSAAATRASVTPRLQTQLANAGAQIATAYATFAVGVRQAELTLINPVAAGDPTSISAVPTATAQAQINTLITTLGASVQSALSTIPRAASQANVIVAGITGANSGSLAVQLNRVFTAASANGGVVQGNLGLLYAATEGAISGSYESTTLQSYLGAIGRPGRIGNSLSPSAFNLTTFGLQSTAAFATQAMSVRSAELNLPFNGSNSITAQTTVVQAQTALVNATSTLAQSVTAGLVTTTASPFSSLLQTRLTGPTAGSLISQLTNLVSTATLGNSVPSYSLSLLYAAVDAATNAALKGIAIDGFLIGRAVPSTTGVVVTPADTTNDATSPSIIGGGNGVTIPVTTGGGVGLGGTGFSGVGGVTIGTGTGTVGTGTGTGTVGTGTGTGTGISGTNTGDGTTTGGTTGTGTGTTTGTGTGTTGLGSGNGLGGVGGGTAPVATGTGTGTGTGSSII